MHVASILAVKGREVRTITPEATVAEALQRLRNERVGALVVSRDGATIAGIISDRDIIYGIAAHGIDVLDQNVSSIMTEKVFTCSAHERVSSIMATMTNRRIRHLPVVEEDGRLGGIISIGDVVKQRLDEIQSETAAMHEYISGTR